MGVELSAFRRELTVELARNRTLQASIERLLDRFKRACLADCALVAIPDGDGAVRVLAAGLDGLEMTDAALPAVSSPQCMAVIETRDVVAIADVGGLPRDEVCTFMRAEDFSGFLGIPAFIDGAEPVAVVAALSHAAHRWKESNVALGRAAAAAFSETIVAAGLGATDKPN